jgi:uncharacterized protein YutD
MIMVGGRTFELVHEHKNAWNLDAFKERYSEVLDRYDFVVGDWGYNQLRLRGFFRDSNAKGAKDTLISSLQDYLQEYCNFGCGFFVLERAQGKNSSFIPTILETPSWEGNDNSLSKDGVEHEPAPTTTMKYSDRKPYAWRENQSPHRLSGRHAATSSSGSDTQPKTETVRESESTNHTPKKTPHTTEHRKPSNSSSNGEMRPVNKKQVQAKKYRQEQHRQRNQRNDLGEYTKRSVPESRPAQRNRES